MSFCSLVLSLRGHIDPWTSVLAVSDRIVITGIGLTSPNGDSLGEFRQSLLEGRSGVVPYQTRYMPPVLAGVCQFDELRYQKRKDLRRGTRAGSIAVLAEVNALPSTQNRTAITDGHSDRTADH